jgi:hypothetical protein
MDTDEPAQKDIDAIVSYLIKEEQAPVELDKQLTKLVEWIVSEKDRYLTNLTSSKEDMAIFNSELSRISSIRHKLRLMDETVTDVSLKADIWEVVVTAFITGINLGQYSEPIDLVKDIEKSRRQSEAQKGSVESKRLKNENTWIPIALELAKLARIAGEKSLDDVASYIRKHWRNKTDKIYCPSHGTLKNYVSNWIKEEKLAPKNR